jgi:SsrA-binding protein
MAIKQIVYNKKANFEYEILEKYEAGIVLQGTEVKSIKAGKCSIGEAYLIDKDEELFIKGMNISEYSQGNIHNHEPLRIRKLLLHKKEIREILRGITEEGNTAVPLAVFLKDSLVKVTIALVKGKKLYDKRETIRDRDNKRELDRIKKEFRQ